MVPAENTVLAAVPPASAYCPCVAKDISTRLLSLVLLPFLPHVACISLLQRLLLNVLNVLDAPLGHDPPFD